MAFLIPLLLSFTHFLAKSNADPTTTTSTNLTTTTDFPDLPDPSFDYAEITKQPFFVDKTDLLQALFEPSDPEPSSKYPVHFITVPPNFGKTVNLNMIKQFVQIQLDSSKTPIPPNQTNSYTLFSNLSIAQNKSIIQEHLARYPVISLDLLDIALLGFQTENILEELHYRIQDSVDAFIGIDHLLEYFDQHGCTEDEDAELNEISFLENLKNSALTEQQMEFALYMLAKSYYQYFNKTKVIILITEYDHCALHYYRNNKDSFVGAVYKIINQILKRTFDFAKDLIQFAVITSSSTLSYSLDCSMHDMITHHAFLEEHRFTPYFGFTETDLEHLFAVYKCEDKEKKIIKDFYKAYQTTGKRLVYNPYSITEYFKARKPDSKTSELLKGYWKKTMHWEYVCLFLKNPVFRDKINTLLQSRQVQHSIRKLYDWNALFELEQLRDREYEESEDTHIDMYFTFYFELGLFSHTDQDDVFGIPNNEAQLAYEDILRAYRTPKTTTTQKSFNSTVTTLKATS